MRFHRICAIVAIMLWGAPLQAEEIKIPHDGVTLNAELTRAARRTLADGVVLIVHGTLSHNRMETIRNLSTVLVERGLTTLAINLSLGVNDRHGPYDCKIAHRHRYMDAVREIGAWLDWLQARGARNVTLMGHSRGGAQAARMAADAGAAGKSHPLVRRVALLAPGTWSAGAAARTFERRHGRPLAPDMEKARALIAAGNGAHLMPRPGLLSCTIAGVTADSFVSYYAPDPRFDTPSILKDIAVPTLVIAGGEDNVVKGLAEKVRPQADGKRLRFALIDDANHFFLDLFAEDVADLVEELLGASS
ncbi:MAG: alpha/beta hydrolase [Rhodospirillaceae bacterium]|jgi:pimeloyl-ACP methyl ester carboxylesterase|nr:alpha/beta hydrolase [Rhodospirillaceae bacterium]